MPRARCRDCALRVRGLACIAVLLSLLGATALLAQENPATAEGAMDRVAVLTPQGVWDMCQAGSDADTLASYAARRLARELRSVAPVQAEAMPPGDSDARGLLDQADGPRVPEGFDYVVESRFSVRDLIPRIDVTLADSLRTLTVVPVLAQDAGEECPALLDGLLRDAAEGLAAALSRRIRIAVLNFPMMGGNPRYSGLDASLPAMLSTGLVGSSRLALVESLDREQLESRIQEALAPRVGMYEANVARRIGRILVANYLVMGQFWEMDGSLRLDVRVVKVETAEVIASRGVNIAPIAISTLEDRLSALAFQLRAAIETDIWLHGERPQYVAVAGRAPIPNTGEARLMLEEMIRAVSRKLNVLSGEQFRVRDGALYPDARVDRWEMSGELAADHLLTIHLDRTDRDRMVLEYDLFSPERPEDLAAFPPILVQGNAVDSALTNIANSVLLRLDPNALTTSPLEGDPAARYRGLYRPLGFVVKGGVSIRRHSDLHLGVGSGGFVSAGMLWIPSVSSRLHVEPFHVAFDFLGSSQQRRVFGADLTFAQVTYRRRPNRSLNVYAGASTGYLGVVRIGPDKDINYDASLGAGLVLGIEQRLQSSQRLTYELTLLHGFSTIGSKTLDGAPFPAGRPGGLRLSLGAIL